MTAHAVAQTVGLHTEIFVQGRGLSHFVARTNDNFMLICPLWRHVKFTMLLNLWKIMFVVAFLLVGGFGIDKFVVDDLEVRLGESEGISRSSTISQENLQKILAGVENGSKENIYFYGLLKLYGISLSKDLAIAAQNFQRASALGHVEATTAYGMMAMSGHGIKQDFAVAMKSFRRGVELGDMVR